MCNFKIFLLSAFILTPHLYAIDNIKVNGSVELYYSTEQRSTDNETSPQIFNKDASSVDFGFNLGLSADLSENVSSSLNVTAVSNLGLENSLGAIVSSSAHKINADGSSFDDAAWVSEAWVEGRGLESTLKLGRQTLDNPLIYTEDWSIDYNSFEAGLIINKSIPSTSLIAAWIGKSNGSADDDTTQQLNSTNGQGLALGTLVIQDGKFNTFATNGAYIFGFVNHSIEEVSFEAWYFNVQSFAQAYWVQADFESNGFLAGLQYTYIKTQTSANRDKAYGIMLGYEDEDFFNTYLSYSQVADTGNIGVANMATGGTTTDGRNGSGSESKLYTEMWWNYGAVSQTGSKSYSLSMEKTAFEVDFLLGYYFSDIKPVGLNNNLTIEELTLATEREFGPVLVELVLIFDEYDFEPSHPESDTRAGSFLVDITYSF